MSIERSGRLISSLGSWLLILALISALFSFRFIYLIQAGSGVVFVFFSVSLGAFTIHYRWSRWLLASAYLSLLIGLLNEFAGRTAPNLISRYSGPIAVFCVVLFWFLFYFQLRLFLLSSGENSTDAGRRLLPQMFLAIAIPSLIGGSVCALVIFFLIYAQQNGIYVPWETNPFVLAMFFVAAFSASSAVVLTWTSRSLNLSSAIFKKAAPIACLVLVASVLAEYAVRKDWEVLMLTAVAFVGCLLSFWELYYAMRRALG